MSSIIKPILGSQLNFGHPLSTGLVGCWFFNEGSGSQIFDLSENGLAGSLIATAHFEAGKFGSAIDFDGNSDYVDLGIPTVLGITTSALTIVSWSKSAVGVAQMILSQGDDAGFASPFYLRRQDGNKIRFKVDTSVGLVFLTTDDLGINDDIWHQIAGVYDGANQHVYLDGISAVAPTAQTGTIDAANAQKYFIGADDTNAGITSYFNGQIDHVMMWNRALSASEIALLYREPFAMFERNPIELWVGSVGAVVGVTVPVMTYHYKQAGGL